MVISETTLFLECYSNLKEKTMTKKGLLVLFLTLITVMGVSADPPDFRFNMGIGGYFTADFPDRKDERQLLGGGLSLFLDFTFVQLSYGFFMSNGKVAGEVSDGYVTKRITHSYSVRGHDIGLMGKYPFDFGRSSSIYPLLGFNYRIASLMGEKGKEITPKNFNALWFKLGGGLDLSAFHIELTYGIRFPNQNGLGFGHGFDLKIAFLLLDQNGNGWF
jgi:hypothetical protein